MVRRTQKRKDEWGEPEVKWGLVATFRGPHRLFDSAMSQEQNGWTDEERERVERHLLAHPDFGRGLYLASGEELTEEMKKVVKNQWALERLVRKCAHLTYEGLDIKQCQNDSATGSDFCDEHEPKAKIIKGMLSTKE